MSISPKLQDLWDMQSSVRWGILGHTYTCIQCKYFRWLIGSCKEMVLLMDDNKKLSTDIHKLMSGSNG